MGSDAEAFEPAEMDPHISALMETLRTHESPELNRVYSHLQDLWMHPDSFEAGEMIERWKNDQLLMVVELGVLFGIEYEKSYPTGRNDEWPIPIEDRPSPDDE